LFLKSINPLHRIRELVWELRRTREECNQACRRNEQLERERQQLRKDIQQLEEEKGGWKKN
jgi:hypothetical protein